MECPECGEDMGEPIDTTYSNTNTKRVTVGQHTGDIYRCEFCEIRWIDNFLSGRMEQWFD